MTPPDSALQVIGGAAVLLLVWLLRPLVRAGLARARLSWTRARRTPPPPPRDPQDEWRQREASHRRDVLRPGLLHVAFDRESVSLGDDSEAHWRLLMFEENLPLSAVLDRPIFRVLASVPGGQATWLLELREDLRTPQRSAAGELDRPGVVRVTPLAVVAQQWSAPRLLHADVPVSRLMGATLHARYLGRQDPAEVAASPHPIREEETGASTAYDEAQVGANDRVMIRVRPHPPGTAGQDPPRATRSPRSS
ncbi:hypothetical protein DEIGR_100932 [Deinococcus grandis]|uniref:Uncharacterized protein n=1 Tax=Deinococcus grandis TaxID=57498 RepID=A0A100HHM4_9DEIO|nr:hypothetical protein [Deinococcus grandis]BBN95606.1 hypothetical protein DEGR_23390 [Deinococcus grandis]GAQ20905.1 hypothetical protein DEIGR_100932 [Deinococcus grandis]